MRKKATIYFANIHTDYATQESTQKRITEKTMTRDWTTKK